VCFYASQCICDCRDELACNCRRFVVDHYRHCWRWQRSTVELKLFRSAAADRQTTEPLASRRLRSLQSARWPTCNVYWIMGIETASIRQCRHDVDCYFLCKQIERLCPVSRSPVFFVFVFFFVPKLVFLYRLQNVLTTSKWQCIKFVSLCLLIWKASSSSL